VSNSILNNYLSKINWITNMEWWIFS